MNAKLLDKFALERIEYGFAIFDFPAWEFLVAVVRLSSGSLAEQHIAVRFHQDADRYVDRLGGVPAHEGVAKGVKLAQSDIVLAHAAVRRVGTHGADESSFPRRSL